MSTRIFWSGMVSTMTVKATGAALASHNSLQRMRAAPHNTTKAAAVIRVSSLSPARRANTQKSALARAHDTAPTNKKNKPLTGARKRCRVQTNTTLQTTQATPTSTP